MEKSAKITQTRKITFYGRVFCSKDLMVWLESLPSDANITVIQTQSYDPREGGGSITMFSTEEVHDEQ